MTDLDRYACVALPLLLVWAAGSLALAAPVRYDDVPTAQERASGEARRRLWRLLREAMRRG
jgi:hypothetical protein